MDGMLQPPAGVNATDDKGKRIASFDGDADRVVYLTFDEVGVRFRVSVTSPSRTTR